MTYDCLTSVVDMHVHISNAASRFSHFTPVQISNYLNDWDIVQHVQTYILADYSIWKVLQYLCIDIDSIDIDSIDIDSVDNNCTE